MQVITEIEGVKKVGELLSYKGICDVIKVGDRVYDAKNYEKIDDIFLHGEIQHNNEDDYTIVYKGEGYDFEIWYTYDIEDVNGEEEVGIKSGKNISSIRYLIIYCVDGEQEYNIDQSEIITKSLIKYLEETLDLNND